MGIRAELLNKTMMCLFYELIVFLSRSARPTIFQIIGLSLIAQNKFILLTFTLFVLIF